MIYRFIKVVDGLYRGSAPSIKDVKDLKEKFNIKKIISLDEESGEKISRVCKLLGIEQIKIYLDNSKKSLLNLLSYDLKELLLDNGPTFVHCQAGKDRTGLVIGLFKCKYFDEDPEEVLNEAKALGFGVGLDPKVTKLYTKLILSCRPNLFLDSTDGNIVSKVREYKSDNRSSFLDEANQGSFSPYLSETRQYPADGVYNFLNEQSPTRENYNQNKDISTIEVSDDVVPQVGVYNSDAGGRSFGPVENAGGFFYD